MDDLDKKNEEISQAFDGLRQARADEGTKDESNPVLKSERAVINRLKAERSEIFTALKPARKAADGKIDKKELNQTFRDKCNAALSVKTCGIYRDTADQIFADFQTAREKARKENATLRFHRFDGTGFYQFRFSRKGSATDGISVDEFMAAGFGTYVRCAVQSIDESKKKPRLHIKADLAGGAIEASKTYQYFDCIYHRPLPPDCQIQNGKILRTRTGDKFRYDMVLTVKLPKVATIPPAELNGTIGIDIGFRRSGDTVLVGTVKSDDPSEPAIEIKVPTQMVSALEHVIELQSELDDAATDLGKVITPLLQANPLAEDHAKHKFWKAIANRPAFVTLSYEQAYKLAVWFNHEPDAFPKEITEKVFGWWRSYSRKYREIHNRRRKQLLHRKHFYRQVASDLVAQKKLIVLEKINLVEIAETKDKDTKLSNKARAQRFLGAVSELRDAIKNAADREGVPYEDVNPAYTSKTCCDCGVVNKELKSEKEWVCPSCGVVHDRDENAASNLAKMAKQYLDDLKKMKLRVVK